jgi:NitT/TauT family transport system ATP-binding protein
MKNKILVIKNLKKCFHQDDSMTIALDGINLDVYKNEFISIVGPSGCGKSTILSILAGLISKTDGDIILADNTSIGYMLQSDSLFPWRTILDNCLIGLEVNNIKNKENTDYVISLLEKYGLGDFLDKYPDSLSGGMRQRVALIRTLALKPDILLLDEPLSALDYQSRLSISDDIYQIIKNEKKTAIMVTHDIGEAVSISDRVIILSKRPGVIKSIYEINLEGKTNPTNNRKLQDFSKYYDIIWRDLDVHI